MIWKWIKKIFGNEEDFNWRQVYLDFKLWSHFATPLNRKRKELEWAEARVEIKSSEAYKKFKEWLVSWAFDYEATGRQAEDFPTRRKYDGSADACMDILSAIEFSPQVAEKTRLKIVEMEEKEEKKRTK